MALLLCALVIIFSQPYLIVTIKVKNQSTCLPCFCFINRFAKSKMQYIEALVEYAKEEAKLSKLRSQLASQQSYIHEDIHSLRYI
jgi:hypothetical protein